MKERDNIHFFDTSTLTETAGIRQRCSQAYVQKALAERLPGDRFKVTAVTINETGSYKAKLNWLVKLLWNNGKVTGLPPYCEVLIEHCTGTEWENIIVWSPLAWNDRFAGTAGGGTCTGGVSQITQPNNGQRGWTLPFAVINGFTAATCDAGNEKYGSNWAVDKNGQVVRERMENWRANATHNMTVFGKAVAEILHERPIQYAYMNGGSGGGRQSMVEAQEFPEDYDGIWASCPAINWTKFLIAGFWPMAAANEHKAPLKYHKLTAFAKAVQESVGGSEKYYQMSGRVAFDPFTLVGQKTKQGVITQADAAVIQDMWDGPHRANGFGMGSAPAPSIGVRVCPFSPFHLSCRSSGQSPLPCVRPMPGGSWMTPKPIFGISTLRGLKRSLTVAWQLSPRSQQTMRICVPLPPTVAS